MSLEDLADLLTVDASDIVRSLFMKGINLSMNQNLDRNIVKVRRRIGGGGGVRVGRACLCGARVCLFVCGLGLWVGGDIVKVRGGRCCGMYVCRAHADVCT